MRSSRSHAFVAVEEAEVLLGDGGDRDIVDAHLVLPDEEEEEIEGALEILEAEEPALPRRASARCRPVGEAFGAYRVCLDHRMNDDSRLIPEGKYPEPEATSRDVAIGLAAFGIAEARIEVQEGLEGEAPFLERPHGARSGPARGGQGRRRGGCRYRGSAALWALALLIAAEARLDAVDGREELATGRGGLAAGRRVYEIGLVLEIHGSRAPEPREPRAIEDSDESSAKAARIVAALSPILEPSPRKTRAIG